MKKYFLSLGVAVLVLMNFASPASAEDDAFIKFGRGMTNILTAPAELYMQPLLLSENHNAFTALFGGLVKGAGLFLFRELIGVYEVVTFPLPLPKDFGPIIEPATPFTEWSLRQPVGSNHN